MSALVSMQRNILVSSAKHATSELSTTSGKSFTNVRKRSCEDASLGYSRLNRLPRGCCFENGNSLMTSILSRDLLMSMKMTTACLPLSSRDPMRSMTSTSCSARSSWHTCTQVERRLLSRAGGHVASLAWIPFI